LYYAVSVSHAPLTSIKLLVAVVAIVGLVSVILTSIAGQVRIFYSMSRDGLLPKSFARLGTTHQTPYVAIINTGIVTAIAAGVLPLGLLGELVSLGTLLAFAMVCIGIIVLRRLSPEVPRPFRTPWAPFVPALGALSCFVLMASLPLNTWLRLIIWIGVGLIVYALYGRRHSRLRDEPIGLHRSKEPSRTAL
jgi:APA family basic amino acid/polyamine antiporter